MKPLLLSITLCFCAVAANAQENPAPTIDPGSTAITTGPSKAGLTGAFDWKLRLSPGQKWEIRTYVRMKQRYSPVPAVATATVLPEGQAPEGQVPDTPPAAVPPTTTTPVPLVNRETQAMVRTSIGYEVLKRDEFGAVTVQLSLRDVSLDTKAIYGQNPEQREQLRLTELEGAFVTVKQSSDGTIWNVVNLERLSGPITRAAAKLSESEKRQAQEFAQQVSSATYWRTFLQSLSGVLPKYPVIVSESWDYETQVPSGLPFPLSYHGKRTLNKRENGVAFIQEEATLNPDNLEPTGPEASSPALDGYRGAFNGASQIDEKTGLTIASNLSFSLSGSLKTIEGIPIAQETNTRFEASGETHLVMERKN